jgi:hypothetical protein
MLIMNTDTLFISINLKWMQDISVKYKTIKLLENTQRKPK